MLSSSQYSSTPTSDKYALDRTLIAVLGPTNTGKTHYAIERMLSFKSGMIGLPLRLLAREVYDRLCARTKAGEVALITGEEKIVPRKPRFWVCTVEAMPLSEPVEFLAIDEIQLAAHPERGHTFTSRLLHARGRAETLFLGASTIAGLLKQLFPHIQFRGRERFSTLTHTGAAKLTRLPRRSAIVSFSATTVYEIAELIRRQRGGAAVVLGVLSPRTRNAQAALYQEGEVDYLVATDAIGMGLNMDIDHVAFASQRKFDGRQMRQLSPQEAAQIAGRAGRHMRDGTFGTSATCRPFDDDMVVAIEENQFDPITGVYWRNEALEFSSIPALLNGLDAPSNHDLLVRARPDDDERALAQLLREPDIRDMASGGASLALLWDICQIPDFQKNTIDQHAALVGDVYRELMRHDRLQDEWLEPHIGPLDRVDGDIDTLSARLANMRSWTYLSNRSQWLANPAYWQDRTRTIEDRLSDALHERLTQRFVDRRTAVLLKRLKDSTPLLAGVTEDGEVIVEGQFVGRLLGFEFILDPRASGAQAKPVRAAAERALRPVLAARASALAVATNDELSLSANGRIRWRTSDVAHLEKGPGPFRPNLIIHHLDQIPAALRGRIEDRLKDFIATRLEALVGPIIMLQQACERSEGDNALSGPTRGIAWRLVENFSATSRHQFGDELKQLPQEERAKLRQAGVRFGEFTLFMPALLKPAPASMLTLLWALWNDREPGSITPPKAGLVSSSLDENIPHAYYYASGYRPSGTRAVRIDMLERLAGEIRKARETSDRREGFEVTSSMMSLVGCSGEDFESILKSLSFRKHTVKRKVSVAAPSEPATEQTQNANAAEINEAPEAKIEATIDEIKPPPATIEETSPEAAPQTKPTTDKAQQEDMSGVATPNDPNPEIMNSEETAPVSAVQSQQQTSEDGPKSDAEKTVETEEIEVTLWRYQAKRPHRPQGRKPSATDGPSAHGKDRAKGKHSQHNAKSNAKKGKPGQRKAQPKKIHNPHMHEPRHRKEADPDSPFAVLASLKDGNTAGGDGAG